uniref:Putative beta-glucan synthesis-associated n=1 Tax=Moniliophthora roreri TaxID=221103 RepID=A0A0W0G5C2_MONRR
MSSLNDVPYSVGSSSRSIAPSSVGEKFSLSPDPKAWGLDLSGQAEPDDHLHNPDPIRDKKYDRGGSIFTSRGLANIGCLVLLSVSIITLFAGFPIVTYLTTDEQSTRGGFNLGGVNASGQIPEVTGNFGLIDPDTPPEAYTFKSVHHGRELQLVFSDEFNRDGRTFYPGDDPYWEAVDLHYWGTNNLEWYDPAALWPYTYDACDVGTLPNQTYPDGSGPELALKDGDRGYDGVLSYLPGQRLSRFVHFELPPRKLTSSKKFRCTCPGESHPGPMHKDGTYVGRSAPEIDMIEAQVGGNFQVPGGPLVGEVSQSGQWAPFNYAYRWLNTSDNLIINDPTITELNPYMGGVYQQATSCVSKTNQACYSQMPNPCFAVYGFEYKPGYDEGYISWLNDGKQVCTVIGAGMAADERVELSARPVPQEPMYILINLGMSYNFGAVDLDHLIFPVSMYVDYIRVYQPPGEINIGCDPPNFPTKAYIEEYLEAYINPNYTTWTNDFGQPKPKNRLVDQCD